MIPGSAQQFSISSAAFFITPILQPPAFLLRITERYVTLRYTFFLQVAFLQVHFCLRIMKRYVTLHF